MFDISPDLMKADAVVFFGTSYISKYYFHNTNFCEDYLAQSIHTFLKEKSIKQDGLTLGFTFPFAIEKSSLDHAHLLGWSKGYSVKGAEGKNILRLLHEAFVKAQVDIKCTAIVTDVSVNSHCFTLEP